MNRALNGIDLDTQALIDQLPPVLRAAVVKGLTETKIVSMPKRHWVMLVTLLNDKIERAAMADDALVHQYWRMAYSICEDAEIDTGVVNSTAKDVYMEAAKPKFDKTTSINLPSTITTKYPDGTKRVKCLHCGMTSPDEPHLSEWRCACGVLVVKGTLSEEGKQ